MVIDSTSKSHQISSDADNTTLLSRSYVQKTVCLQDWWLIKPETDDEKHTLGVAGVTSTSQQQRAERRFSSAPILKVYDFFELETIDGVCVILQGFINRDRTLENGFPPEVFNHFVMGFPPYWEEFAKCWLETVPTVECVSRGSLGHQDGKRFVDEHQEINSITHGKPRHLETDTMDIGFTGDIQTSSNWNEFSPKVIQDSEERNGSAKVFSPVSSSGKRSRSGRLLLPSLEFWRNQTLVYDADRRIAGVMSPTSQGISEDNRTPKKKGNACLD